MATLATLRSKLQGLFDLTDDEANYLLNQAHKRLVADSRWLKVIRDLGTTSSTDATYPIGDDIVEVTRVWVVGTDGPLRYEPVSRDTLLDLQTGRSTLTTDSGEAGVFAESQDPDGTMVVELYPLPDAGLPLKAQVAVLPADMANDAATPAVPEDFHDALIDGAGAIGMAREDERFDSAQAMQAGFDSATSRLAARAHGRARRRPQRARIAGYDFEVL